MKGVQLPLGVSLAESASFDSWFAGPNAEAVRALRAASAGDVPLVLLYGPAGSGKSHLLQAVVRDAAGTRSCAYLPLAEFAAESPLEVTEGLELPEILCIDDADRGLGSVGWSEALLRLLDARRARGLRTIVSASAAPDRLPGLPDLRTRLAAGATYGLKPLDDAQRGEFLRERAKARGLELPPDAADALLSKLPRDPGSLSEAIERLDRDLLSEKRKLTLSFVQQWLKRS